MGDTTLEVPVPLHCSTAVLYDQPYFVFFQIYAVVKQFIRVASGSAQTLFFVLRPRACALDLSYCDIAAPDLDI
jgi:hypothetical protein